MICEECSKVFCMNHRTLEQHSCPSVEARKSKPREVAPVVSTTKGTQLKRKGAKSLALERKVMLMKMKNKSSGPSSIPQSERIYLNVMAEGGKQCYYHCSNLWSVGRSVDAISDHMGLRNNNDQAGAAQLVMEYQGEVLVMGDKLCDNTQSGDTINLKYIHPS